MFIPEMPRFLGKIQSSSEKTKKKLLIVLSALVSVIVFFLWLQYFAVLVQPAAEQSQAADIPRSHFAFLNVMKTGTAVIYHFLADKIYFLINVFKEPKDYIIKP